MTTIVCVWVKGHVPFSIDYVIKLRSMVDRYAHRPHRFVCLTDRPYMLRASGIEAIGIPNPHPLMGWWSKIECFSPKHGLTGRVLYLDLDTLIVDSLAPILDFPAPFALIPHAGNFEGKGGRAVVKRYNSSVMVWTDNAANRIWKTWSPGVADRLWGDQDHIGEQMPQASTMPSEWFPRFSQVALCAPQCLGEARVILVKNPKNEEAARRHHWFRTRWN